MPRDPIHHPGLIKAAGAALFCAVLIAWLMLVTGCAHRVPAIKAESIQQTVSFPGFTSTVDATGVNVTPATIRWEDVSWRISFLGFTSVTTAKGYYQKREKEKDSP